MTKNALLSQVIMTLLMALTMSGTMGLIFTGPTLQWLARWPGQFIIAWPIAFIFTMIAWPAATALTGAILRPRKDTSTD